MAIAPPCSQMARGIKLFDDDDDDDDNDDDDYEDEGEEEVQSRTHTSIPHTGIEPARLHRSRTIASIPLACIDPALTLPSRPRTRRRRRRWTTRLL